ncbi:hypothetical protein ACOSQ4_033193 [Xanthoceras sorbifolium]
MRRLRRAVVKRRGDDEEQRRGDNEQWQDGVNVAVRRRDGAILRFHRLIHRLSSSRGTKKKKRLFNRKKPTRSRSGFIYKGIIA